MNHEFRALQQTARERQATIARWNRYRGRASALLVFMFVMLLFWSVVLTRHWQ